MFHAFRLLLAGCGLALLAACAGTPPVPQAPLPGARPGSAFAPGRSFEVEQTNHMRMHLNEARTIVYSQNFGGGGVGLGLLGPLGVAANIGMIESNTKADVQQLTGKLKLDVPGAFQAAAQAAGADLAGADAPLASPYVLLLKTTPDKIAVAAGLVLEAPASAQPAAADAKPKAPAWTRRYMVQLSSGLDLPALAQADTARDQQWQAGLQKAYQDMLAQIRQETTASIAAEARYTAESTFLTPRFEFEVPVQLIRRDGELVWLRNVGTVVAVLAKDVKLKPVK